MYTVASRSLPQCYRGFAYGSYGVVTVIWKAGFTRQRFARAIIDAETLRGLFVNISRICVISRGT